MRQAIRDGQLHVALRVRAIHRLQEKVFEVHVLEAFRRGLGLVLRIPWWLYTVPFVLIGLVLAVRELLGFGPIRSVPRSTLLLATGTAAALGFAAVVETLVGLRFLLNRCDDFRAYLPMARRLLETYGLEEPWSVRRAQSMGGFDLLRTLPVAVFGNVGVGAAKTFQPSDGPYARSENAVAASASAHSASAAAN